MLNRSEAHYIMVGLPGFACALVRPFKSDALGKINNLELSFLSRKLKIINLDLVSMTEIEEEFFAISSGSLRSSVKNSRHVLMCEIE